MKHQKLGWKGCGLLVVLGLVSSCGRPVSPFDPEHLNMTAVFSRDHGVTGSASLLLEDNGTIELRLDVDDRVKSDVQGQFKMWDGSAEVDTLATFKEFVSSKDNRTHTLITLRPKTPIVNPDEAHSSLIFYVKPFKNAAGNRQSSDSTFHFQLQHAGAVLQESNTQAQLDQNPPTLSTRISNPSLQALGAFVLHGRCIEGSNVATFYQPVAGLAAKASLQVDLRFRNGERLGPAAQCDLWGLGDGKAIAIK